MTEEDYTEYAKTLRQEFMRDLSETVDDIRKDIWNRITNVPDHMADLICDEVVFGMFSYEIMLVLSNYPSCSATKMLDVFSDHIRTLLDSYREKYENCD